MKRCSAAILFIVVFVCAPGCVASRPVQEAQSLAEPPATVQSITPPDDSATTQGSSQPENLQAITGWFCPMHPNHTSHEGGSCPICGMALMAGDPFDTRDYLLDFETFPSSVKAGVPFTLVFHIRHPGTGTPVTEYEVVHDKQFHLFLISHDLSVFQHIHPEFQEDGSWLIEVTVPKPGYYGVLSDFVPSRGSPQFLARTLITVDAEGDLASAAARLEVDRDFTKTVDTITASVEFEPQRLVAGEYGHLRFTLTDATTGQPVTNLQPYLGAFGHTLILSEDMLDYVHSHPSEGPESDLSRGLGGPGATFEGYMPRPGRYRSWTQFLRNDQLTTVSFTFDVLTLDEAMRVQR